MEKSENNLKDIKNYFIRVYKIIFALGITRILNESEFN